MRTAHAIALDALAGLLAKRPLRSGATRDLFEIEVDAVERDKGRPLDVALIPLNPIGCGNDTQGHKSGGHSVPRLIEQVEHEDCGGADQRDSAKADEREVEEGHGSGACSCGGEAGGEESDHCSERRGATALGSAYRSAVYCGATMAIAESAHRRNIKRLEIVAVVVPVGGDATVSAGEQAWPSEATFANSASHLIVGLLLERPVELVDGHLCSPRFGGGTDLLLLQKDVWKFHFDPSRYAPALPVVNTLSAVAQHLGELGDAVFGNQIGVIHGMY